MARTETTNFSHSSATTSLASSVIPRSNINPTKDQLQRSEIIKNEFTAREGTYKISSLIDNLNKTGTNTCLNESVKITVITRTQPLIDSTSVTSSRRSSTTNNHHTVSFDSEHSNERRRSSIETSPLNGNGVTTEILAFNVGREFILYEFTEATQSNYGEPIDHRIYKQNHLPTCHDIVQDPDTNILHVVVGFSKGQIQYINMHTKEQKVFNEGSYLDKTKVTCVKWLSSPKTYFAVSYSSGHLYVFDEQLNHQRDTNFQPTYTTIKDEEKNFSISYLKNKTKQARNPVARWSIGNGSINQFAFSPDHSLLAIVSQDGFLRIFNYEKMELTAYMKSYFGGLLCVCWSPDGKYLATGGEDDFLTLFSLDSDDDSPRVLCRGYGHTSWISAIAFDPYMNAKTYYSSFVQRPSSSSSLNKDEENYNDQIKHSTTVSRSNSTSLDNHIPSVFYRIGSVGQDNRLCFWDITDDVLKINKIHFKTKNIRSNSLVDSSTSNGYASFLSDTTPLTSNNPSISTTKSSFTAITSRLSFSRGSNKVQKYLDETSDTSLVAHSNGSSKKSRKLTSTSGSKSPSLNGSALGSLTTLTNNSFSSRRMNIDLTKSIFGTNRCPRLDEIQMIEPIVTELISNERLNAIHFGENYFLTASQDGIIAIWEKPSQTLPTDDQATALINSNSHHSNISQRL